MNYNDGGLAAGAAGAAVLAATGPAAWVWYTLAAFALIAAGSALLRIIPRHTRSHS